MMRYRQSLDCEGDSIMTNSYQKLLKANAAQRAESAKRTARYEERMRSAGYDKAHVWVHSEDREKLLKYAERLRKSHEQT